MFDKFAYVPGVTTIETTAAQALAGGRGVCQDYAHVLVSLCRELGIPARYIAGLMIGEGATHAWVEVHDGTRWRGLDPTHNVEVDDRYLVLAEGRDFEDCPIERGVFRGAATQEQQVNATVGDGSEAPNVAASLRHEPAGGDRRRSLERTVPSAVDTLEQGESTLTQFAVQLQRLATES